GRGHRHRYVEHDTDSEAVWNVDRSGEDHVAVVGGGQVPHAGCQIVEPELSQRSGGVVQHHCTVGDLHLDAVDRAAEVGPAGLTVDRSGEEEYEVFGRRAAAGDRDGPILEHVTVHDDLSGVVSCGDADEFVGSVRVDRGRQG